MLKIATVGFLLILTVSGLGGCSSGPVCHLNGGGLYIKFNPCDGKKPTKLELRRRKSAHRL
jgi:hypothetical protein